MQRQLIIPKKHTTEFLPLLEQSVLFSGLSTMERREILAFATIQTHNKESFIFHQYEPATSLFLLAEGVVHLSQLTVKGQQVILHYLCPGDELGLVALSPDLLLPVTAVAATECTLICWSKEKLNSLIIQYPQLILNALQLMTARFINLQNQYRQLATERVERRVARTLLHIANKTGKPIQEGLMLAPIPSRQQLAEMTSTTTYTVSRICSKWEKDGLVQANRHSLLIHDIAAFTALIDESQVFTQSTNNCATATTAP